MNLIKITLILALSFTLFDTNAQNNKIAFLNENALIDSCAKYKFDSQDEIDMMYEILSKKEEELKNESDTERKKILEKDIQEYKMRIEERKKVIVSEDHKSIERNRAKNTIEEAAKKICKKRNYRDYVDISNNKPSTYTAEDDITKLVWEKIK